MRWWLAPIHLSVFLGMSLAAYIAITVVLIIALLFTADMDLLADPDAIVQVLGAGGQGAMALALHLTIGVTAALLALVLPLSAAKAFELPRSLRDVVVRTRDALAFRRGALVYLVPAALGALTIGLAAGWLSERVQEALPDYPNNLELISQLLREGTGIGWGILVVAVVLSAPFFEEIAFRGYLWTLFERAGAKNLAFLSAAALGLGALTALILFGLGSMGLWGAVAIGAWSVSWLVLLVGTLARPDGSGWRSVAPLVLTSLLFMAYHQDPIHVLGLAPTAFFLGWLRMVSGSIWPSILAHFVNNSLAISFTLFLAEDSDLEVTFPIALAALAFTGLVCGITWFAARPAAQEA